MSPEATYDMRIKGLRAIDEQRYAVGLDLLARVTIEETKNRDTGQPVIAPPHREIPPRYTDRVPKITDEELEEERRRIVQSYRKPITKADGGQLQLFA